MIHDPSGRGPTTRQLLIAGIVMVVLLSLLLYLLMLRYQGKFEDKVPVVANLTTTGDGLPADADVKFRGVLVGTVAQVSIAALGEKQRVEIDMKPEFANKIPQTVTARVVPSNLFAVTSVELLDNGPGPGLREGSQIAEDTSKGTIALQTTLTTVRKILSQIDPMKLGRVLGNLQAALDGNGRMPGSTIERLDRWLTEIDAATPDLGADLTRFAEAARAINESEPALLDMLASTVKTAQTVSSRRGQIAALLSAGLSTTDSVNALFARNPNAGKDIVSGTNVVFGALASDPHAITRALVSLNVDVAKLDTVFHGGPKKQMVWNVDVNFQPFKPNTLADCPRYGDLAGPSCFTAPATAYPGTLPPELLPKWMPHAGPKPVDIPQLPAAAPAPAAPVIPGLPGFPILPPGIQLPGIPGLTPPPPPAGPVQPAGLRDVDAIEEIMGTTPSAEQYLLMRALLGNGSLTVTDSPQAKGGSK